MKWPFNKLLDPTEPIHPVEDQKYYQNYYQSGYLKTIDLQEGSWEEDTLEEEASQEEYQEEGEDIQEVEDPQEQDPLEEADGDPHQFQYCNHMQEN